MANVSNVRPQLPVDAEGICMSCNKTPDQHGGTISCAFCGSSWHLSRLRQQPKIAEEYSVYECPDCSGDGLTGASFPSSGCDMVSRIKVIDEDASLTEQEKAERK